MQVDQRPSFPLHVHPWPLSPERMALLKAAKASLTDVDILVVPHEAIYGVATRILAFGERPPFICNYALIAPENVDNVQSIANALQFVLTAPPEAAPFDHAHWLSDVFGVPVTQVTDPFRLEAMDHEREMTALRRQGVPV